MMSIARHALAIPAILLAGCVTIEPQEGQVDPVVLAEHEVRLTRQFKGGHVVVCKTLDIEASGFMFNNNLTLPAGQPRRDRTDLFEAMTWAVGDQVKMRERMPGAQPAWDVKPRTKTRKRQAKRDKFRIMVGSTAFIVDDRITVRRLFRAPPTLTAHAKGHVMVIRDGKDASNFQEVRFVDGRVEARQ